MKRKMLWILALLMSLTSFFTAQAGYNEVNVATDGLGIGVYATSAGGKQVGILYNGYSAGLSLEDTNGLYACSLTAEYSVWLDQNKAEKNAPDGSGRRWKSEEWQEKSPCELFVAEVIQPDAPLYTAPSHKHLTAKHAVGTLVKVCGEFGNDYYVDDGGWGQTGFMPKTSLRRYSELTYRQANYHAENWGLPGVQTRRVYTRGGPIAIGASATGFSEANPQVLKNGDEVTVLRTLGSWAQLNSGYFIESRFLDPQGDHAVTYATVKTDGILNRLNVRGYASTDAWAKVKLCSGTRVQVAAHTDQWASVLVIGPQGGESYSGSVQMKYLAFGEAADQVKNGCVRVKLTEKTYINDNLRGWNADAWQSLPAGTELTVMGVYDGYNIETDDTDAFLCLTEEGKTVRIWNTGTLLPVGEALGTAKTASQVRMRAAPSKEAEVIRTLGKGTKAEVLLRGEGWTLVRVKDQTGYVMSRYLNFP